MNEQIETILRNPSVLKTVEGDDYTDDTAAKWAWFAHGYDTGMQPFYSIDQLREAVRSVMPNITRIEKALALIESETETTGLHSAACELREALKDAGHD